MIKVFTAAGRLASRLEGVRSLAIALVAWTWIGASAAPAQEPATKPADAASDAAKAAPDAAEDEVKPATDPSASHKAAAVELFKDPAVEPLLDPSKFPEIRAPKSVTSQEIGQLKQMAASPLVPVDVNVITNVVNAMVGEMTKQRNLQALRDPASEKNPSVLQAVQVASQNLLEPVFTSRSAKNVQFQTRYNQVLLQKLPPLLKHHLVARIQAMIILAQSGNPEALKVFLDEIKSPTQTVWVKLWAFRGITNIKLHNNRLSTSQEADAAKVIADQLPKGKEWPSWVQVRALEAMGALRQGFLPTSPRTGDMAAATFQYLIDESLRPEVRSEAAMAMGSLQTAAVPKYNYELVAYAVAQLAANLIDQVAEGFSENPVRAQEITTILIGPVFQAFEGQPGIRDSGLLNNPSLTNKAEVQKYFDALKVPAKVAAALVTAPTGQIEALTKDLKAKIAAFKAFLAKTPPADSALFTGGPTYTGPAAPAAGPQAAASGANATGGARP